jgi:EH domain-containing protein 1
MDHDRYIEALRSELLRTVESHLSPVALQYGYSEVPLETNIKWRPLVLVLGNYSSGKSALINEFLGADIQTTGQAPTDDSFTILTYDNGENPADPVRLVEERDGKHLLNDPEYPFESLKKHGQRFAAHFRLKKVNSPFLKTLALIDTPGMLDSITERDRGYNYQDVVGDLAQIADLILVLFDPHKAGTIREAHISLRDTLPTRTFEDRVLFVLNRIDECASLNDLLRVFGTLCWNLSQITGRKDIPMIHLTYSPRAAAESRGPEAVSANGFLEHLENTREALKRSVQQAPRRRLDHLATFVETHSERLSHFMEGLLNYRRQLRNFRFKMVAYGLLLSLLAGAGTVAGLMTFGLLPIPDPNLLLLAAGGLAAVFYLLWGISVRRWLEGRFHRSRLQHLDQLTPLESQTRKDSWQSVRQLVARYLTRTGGTFPLWEVKEAHLRVAAVFQHGTREIREAMNELALLMADDRKAAAPGPYLSALVGERSEADT